MLGIEEIKEVIALPLALHMAFDKAKADGVVDAADLVHLVDPIVKAPEAIMSAEAALEEVKDLDDAERAELYAHVQAVYDISDDVLEEKVEAAIDAAFSIARLIGVLGKEEEPTPAA